MALFPNIRQKIKEFFQPTPEIRFRDIIRELPAATGKVLVETGQSVARNIASAGLTIATAIAPEDLKPYTDELSADDFFRPIRGMAKKLFGEQPIKSIERRIAEAEPKVQEWGQKLQKSFPEGTGLHKIGYLMESYPTLLAFPAIMGSVGLDLVPFGGLEKNTFRKMIETKTPAEAIALLTKMGIADDIAKIFADDVVKVADEKSAKALFNRLAEIQRTTIKAPVEELPSIARLEQLKKEIIGKVPGTPEFERILTEAKRIKAGLKTDISITPPPKPPRIPPSPKMPEMPEFQGKPTIDPIVVLNDLLKEAKPVRAAMEKVYTAERAKRISAVQKYIETQIDNVGGEEAYRNILAKLKGELIEPEAKIRFEPIKEKLTEEQLTELFKRTWKHPYLDEWEKISAAEGLMKLLEGDIPQPKQLVLLEEIYGTDLIKNVLRLRPLGWKIKDAIVEAANIPRMFLTMADMSGFLRQGIVPVVAHPEISLKAIAKTFQFAFSPKAFEDYFKILPKDKLYPLMRKAGLSITDPTKKALGLVGREEATIAAGLVQKIPFIKHIAGFTERTYVGFLNKLRVDLFKTWADELLSKGYSPVKDIDMFKAVANVVNTFTGRGDLGRLNRITPELNTLFFSPRLQAARFSALNPFWYASLPPEIRKKAITDFAKFVAAGLTILAIIKFWKEVNNIPDDQLSIETDLRSSDAGKIKIGNTRLDIWGGFQQWARVFAQLITGQRKNTATGEIVSLTKDEYPFTTRKEVLLRFIEGKLAPIPGLINELMSGGKTFTGEDITFETVAKEKFIPMYIQDIADAYADGGLGRAIGAGIASFFGIGVQTWEERGRVLAPPGLEELPGLPGLPGLPPMPGIPGVELPPMPGIK